MQRVNDDDVTMTDDYCYLYQGAPFTGIAERILNGQRVSEYTYRNGSRAGRGRVWDYEEGYLKQDAIYSGNAIHGMDQCWYENGRRKSLQKIEHGVCTKGITWDQFGQIVDIYVLDESDRLFDILQSSRILYERDLALSEAQAAREARLEDELDAFIEANT